MHSARSRNSTQYVPVCNKSGLFVVRRRALTLLRCHPNQLGAGGDSEAIIQDLRAKLDKQVKSNKILATQLKHRDETWVTKTQELRDKLARAERENERYRADLGEDDTSLTKELHMVKQVSPREQS